MSQVCNFCEMSLSPEKQRNGHILMLIKQACTCIAYTVSQNLLIVLDVSYRGCGALGYHTPSSRITPGARYLIKLGHLKMDNITILCFGTRISSTVIDQGSPKCIPLTHPYSCRGKALRWYSLFQYS